MKDYNLHNRQSLHSKNTTLNSNPSSTKKKKKKKTILKKSLQQKVSKLSRTELKRDRTQKQLQLL
jgi:hypothetical protein